MINSRRSDAPRPGAAGPDYGALDIKRDTGTSRRLEEVPPQWSNDGGSCRHKETYGKCGQTQV